MVLWNRSALALLCLIAPSPTAALALEWSDLPSLVERDPRLLAAKERAAAVSAQASIGGVLPHLELAGALGTGRPRDTGGSPRDEWSAEATLPLGWLWRELPALAAARASRDAACFEVAATRLTLLLETSERFWSVAEAEAQVALAEESLAQTERLAGLVERRVAQGEARPVELPRVAIERSRARAARDQALGERDERRALLALAAGTDTTVAPLPVDTPLTWEPVPGDAAARLPEASKAEARLPETAAAEARVREAEAGQTAARARFLPDLSVGVYAERELDRAGNGVALKLELPLASWASGTSRESARLAADRLALDAARRAERGALITLRSACARSVASFERYRTAIVPSALAASALARRAFEVGESSLLETIDLERERIAVRREQLAERFRAERDCAALRLFTDAMELR